MKSKHSVKAIFACYKLVFKSCPFLSICEIVSYLGSAIVSGFMTLVWKNLFDSISLALVDKSIVAVLNAILVFGIFQVMEERAKNLFYSPFTNKENHPRGGFLCFSASL